jgi:hypothetical protein
LYPENIAIELIEEGKEVINTDRACVQDNTDIKDIQIKGNACIKRVGSIQQR